jgi:hypothetical protein
MTPEEKRKANVNLGIAKAKERRRLAQEKKQKQTTRGTDVLGPPLPPVSRRPPTIPKSPKFASGPIRPRERQPASQYQSLVQCTIEFGKGLRDDSSHASAGSKHSRSSSQRSLTVPQEPKLQTAKYGSKSKFLVTEKPALALSQSVLQKELRGPYQPLAGRREGVTIPVTPKFQAPRQRAPPKSTVQQEEELMAYNNAHPFKAKPPSQGRSSIGSRRSMDSRSRFSDHFRAATASSSAASSHRAGRQSFASSEASASRAQSHIPDDNDDSKANPVPNSTNQYTPIVPKASTDLVDSIFPELHFQQPVAPISDLDENAQR